MVFKNIIMITDWEKSINFVLEMEGGYTVDSNDPGGQTKYGISKKSYPDIDIINLTIDDAKNIYERDFWIPCRCDVLPSPFAISLFDCAVNQGVRTSIKIFQKSLGVDTDGIIGPKTLDAAMNAKPRSVKLFLAERLSAYSKLMAANESLRVFSTNWFFRVLSLAELIFNKT